MPEARTVVVLGATSGIGRALADGLTADGHRLVLTGRRRAEVEGVAADLRIRRGVATSAHVVDAGSGGLPDAMERVLDDAGDGLEGVVCCIGHLGETAGRAADAAEAHRLIDVNLAACVAMLEPCARRLEARGGGFLCALSSVAGDRGRRGNYLYGAAKAGLNVYLQGLRHRLGPAGVRVVTVKLGPVDTRMSYGRREAVMAVPPERAARAIRRALRRGPTTVYVPARWRWIMLVIRSLPEWIFRRVDL